MVANNHLAHAEKILIVDDDILHRRMVRYVLIDAGYSVAAVGGAQQAFDVLKDQPVDLIVLDIEMPGMDGYEFCRTLRERRFLVPVLFLSAHEHVDDTIAGFDAGGDDYLVKPFEPLELTARVHAILQRQVRGAPPPLESTLSIRGYTLDLGELVVRLPDGGVVPVTPTEQRILQHLMVNAGHVMSRDQLSQVAFPERHDGDSNEIEVYIGRIRRKLKSSKGEPCIETVRGVGYRFIRNTARAS